MGIFSIGLLIVGLIVGFAVGIVVAPTITSYLPPGGPQSQTLGTRVAFLSVTGIQQVASNDVGYNYPQAIVNQQGTTVSIVKVTWTLTVNYSPSGPAFITVYFTGLPAWTVAGLPIPSPFPNPPLPPGGPQTVTQTASSGTVSTQVSLVPNQCPLDPIQSTGGGTDSVWIWCRLGGLQVSYFASKSGETHSVFTDARSSDQIQQVLSAASKPAGSYTISVTLTENKITVQSGVSACTSQCPLAYDNSDPNHPIKYTQSNPQIAVDTTTRTGTANITFQYTPNTSGLTITGVTFGAS